MGKSGVEPMSCGDSPTPPAACAWSAHWPSKPTKTGSKPTATSIWTNCASRRKPNYAKPHDQHHDRQFAELDAHNRQIRKCRDWSLIPPYAKRGEGDRSRSEWWRGNTQVVPRSPPPCFAWSPSPSPDGEDRSEEHT